MPYFQNITTLTGLEKERRRLAKIHHPDVEGGSLTVMQEINAEYERARKRLETPPQSRVYTYPCSRPGPTYGGLSDLLEQMMRQAQEVKRQAAQEERERQRQEYRSQVDEQRQKLKEELQWANGQCRAAQSQGLLRNCLVFLDFFWTHLFVSGSTYPYREWFKEHGFRWDADKKQWYFHKRPHKSQDESEVEEDDDDDDYSGD